MPTYARDTSVPVTRTRDQIEKVLTRYGATSFAHGWDQEKAVLGFEIAGRRIRFLLPLPARDAREFTHTPTGIKRPQAGAEKAWEQAQRQRWRALLLLITAQLEAVEAGIVTVEEAFLAHVALPDGSTVGEWASRQLEQVYELGQMPAMLAIEPPRRS